MKKYFLLLLFTAISYAQTTGVTKLKITANPEKTAATRVVVQDAVTGEVGYVNKTTIATLDATTTATGKIQLAGDLSGTATAPTVPALLTKEPIITSGTTSQYFRGDKTWQTLDKTAVGLGNVDNTSDLNKPISTATQTALNAKENTANKNTANGYAGLGSDGKLISSQLPSITISDTFVVGSQSAMLAVTAETGDVAVRTDLNKSFILKGTNPAVLTDWQELLSPTSTVTSVFGRTGAVTAQSGDYTTAQVTETTNKKYQTDNQALYNDATSSIQTQLNNKIAGDGTTNYIPKFFGTKLIGNSLIYDNGTNVGIGTTSPVSLLHLESGNPILTLKRNNHATNTAAAINFTTSDNTLKWQVGVNQIIGTSFEINEGVTNRLSISTGGNVGIGTTSPANKLSVFNTASLPSGSSLTEATILVGDTGSNRRLGIGTSTSGQWIQSSYPGVDGIASTLLLNPSGGNVGIGTTSPAQKLDVFGTSRISNTTPIQEFFSTVNGDVWGSIRAEASAGTGGQLVFSTKRNGNSAADRIKISESGNTLFYPPNFLPITISGVGAPYYGSNITLSSDAGSAQSANRIFSRYDGTGRAALVFETATNTQSYQSDPTGLTYTEYMRIDGNGKVGIGTASPSEKLTVVGNIRADAIGLNAAVNSTYPVTIGCTSGASGLKIVGRSDNLGYIEFFNANGTTVNSSLNGSSSGLQVTGATTFSSSVTATGFFQSSDLRLKDIISRDGDVITYKWKDKRDDKIHIGYVAQEVQKENPDQVNADEKGILSVNYIEILVQKIKDLENRIKQLEK